jgi:two-component system chemotaxis response regulator CheY
MSFNILVVDDSVTARRIILKTLALTGLPLGQVLEAASGREGLERMRSAWMDLVLADLNMPDMSGVAMIEAMAADPLLAKLPVVVVSSEGDQTVLDSLAERGVREFVRKPFNPGLLRDVMVRVLGEPAEAPDGHA